MQDVGDPRARSTPAPASATERRHSLRTTPRVLTALVGLLLLEAAFGLVVAILLSSVADGVRETLGTDAGRAAEERARFAAAGAFIFAIAAAITARGAWRRRTWAWTTAAFLQLIVAIVTGIAMFTAGWHPLYLLAFVLAALVMLVLSTGGVRRALGQE